MNGLPVPPEGNPPRGGVAGKPPRPDQRLGRSRRLTKTSDFEETFAQQKKWVGRFMVLWLRSAADARLRLGLVTSRKVGGAVQRVRARRMMREVFRRNRHRLHGNIDFVLVGRSTIVTAKLPDIEKDFLVLAGKAGVCSAP